MNLYNYMDFRGLWKLLILRTSWYTAQVTMITHTHRCGEHEHCEWLYGKLGSAAQSVLQPQTQILQQLLCEILRSWKGIRVLCAYWRHCTLYSLKNQSKSWIFIICHTKNHNTNNTLFFSSIYTRMLICTFPFQHLKSSAHQQYANNDDNFTSIDKIIAMLNGQPPSKSKQEPYN